MKTALTLLVSSLVVIAGCAASADDDESTESTESGFTAARRKPKPCSIAIRCAAGYTPVDTDGDGCNDNCVPN